MGTSNIKIIKKLRIDISNPLSIFNKMGFALKLLPGADKVHIPSFQPHFVTFSHENPFGRANSTA